MSFIEFKQTAHNRETNKKLVKILHALLSHEDSVVFRKPVPHKALGLQDYKKIIKKPMDLNQVRRNNNQNKYKFLEEALDEIQLCWNNCMRYNHSQSSVYKQAQTLEQMFWAMIKENFGDSYDEIETAVRSKVNKDESPLAGNSSEVQNQLSSYSLNKKRSRSRNNVINQGMQEQSINEISIKNQEAKNEEKYHKMQEQNHNESQQQCVGDSHMNNSALLINREPIQINLNEKPTISMIKELNAYIMEKNLHQEKGVMQNILDILMTYEKDNILSKADDNIGAGEAQKNRRGMDRSQKKQSQLNFNMANIHLTTYYRICKAIRMESNDMLEIIQ